MSDDTLILVLALARNAGVVQPRDLHRAMKAAGYVVTAQHLSSLLLAASEATNRHKDNVLDLYLKLNDVK